MPQIKAGKSVGLRRLNTVGFMPHGRQHCVDAVEPVGPDHSWEAAGWRHPRHPRAGRSRA
jgi:hypothetical protein